jgi:rsbT co-antagonist protein RsbR
MPDAGPSGSLMRLAADAGQEIIDRWTAIVVESLRGRSSEAETEQLLADLFEALVKSQDSPEAEADLRAALGDVSRQRARQGFSPRETAVLVFSFKRAVLELLETRADLELYKDFLRLSSQLDDLGLYTIEQYTDAREAVISEQAAQLLELSTPVIKLFEGILLVPLVGTLDSARTQVVMESLLESFANSRSSVAIIDITGVPAVDTQVAQHLLRTVTAARLMGAECMISGIRPQIAQTVVALGIEFGDVVTKATLGEAVVVALRRTGTDLSFGTRRSARG